MTINQLNVGFGSGWEKAERNKEHEPQGCGDERMKDMGKMKLDASFTSDRIL